MTRISTVEARDQFSTLLNQVAFGKKRVILTRRGKALVAMVPMEDLALLEELEDRLDVEAARAALAESEERIPYEQVRRELGL